MSGRNQNREHYEFGPFRVDVTERVLTKGQQVIPLTPKAFDTLVVLVRNSGRVVEKDELLKHVWPDTFVEEGVLAVNVAAIRKVLSDGEGQSYIETVPRRGYRFVGEVRQVGKTSEAEDVPNDSGQRKKVWSSRWGLAAGLLALVLAGFGWYLFRSQPTSIPPTSPPIPLTTYPGIELNPTFSPDGTQVAFSWNGERQDNFDIYVKFIDRSDAVRLTSEPASDGFPAWSPDGRHIAFVRDGTIFMVSPLGGAERRVANVQARELAWTQDGKFLVVSAGNLVKSRLRLVSLETGEAKDLTEPPFSAEPHLREWGPAVSPDGLNVAFVRQIAAVKDLYLMPLADGEPRLLMRDVSYSLLGVTWTPDGHELVYAAGPSTGATVFWRRSVQAPVGSPSKRIEWVEPGALTPVISRGTPASPARLAYMRPISDTNIWVRDTTVPSQPAHKVVASTRHDINPQFSHDGRRLAFTSQRSGPTQIWVANSDGSNPMQLTSFSGGLVNSPRWSPDGKTIVFTSSQDKNQDIYAVLSNGGAVRRLTSAVSREGRASWSRDGQWIYFYSTRTGREEVWRMPAEGGEAIQLTTGGGHESFESPDGKLLYYEDFGATGLRSISIETYSGPMKGSPVLTAVQPGFWAVTEKGIYFVEFGEREASSGHDLRDASETMVANVSKQIKLYDFGTHKITEIGRIERDVLTALPGFSATWDGRFVAWSQIDQRESDLMMIENFR
jgi:Tol biopolymer transport system component/DNA-binding winged helix-turn-helix (wHTH) protein